MFLQKLKLAPLAVAAVAIAAAALAAAPTPDAPAAAPPPPPVSAARGVAPPAPKAATGPNRIVIWRGGELVALDPDGANEKTVLPAGPPRCHPQAFAVSPDGKRAVCMKSQADGEFVLPQVKLFVREFGADGAVHAIDHSADEYSADWSGDGTRLVVSAATTGATRKDLRITHFVYTPATKARAPVPLPDRHVITDWSRDGRFFLTLEFGADDDKPPAGVWVVNRDGTPRKRLTGAGASYKFARFSPDGGRVLAARFVAWADDEKENDRLEAAGRDTRSPRVRVEVIDAATARATPLKDMPLDVDYLSFCWSPDGRRVAYTWRERHPPAADDAARETQSHLTVCDADGGNQRTILTERGASESLVMLAGVDWR